VIFGRKRPVSTKPLQVGKFILDDPATWVTQNKEDPYVRAFKMGHV